MSGNGMCPFGIGKGHAKCVDVGCEIWDNIHNQCSFRSFVGTLEQLITLNFMRLSTAQQPPLVLILYFPLFG